MSGTIRSTVEPSCGRNSGSSDLRYGATSSRLSRGRAYEGTQERIGPAHQECVFRGLVFSSPIAIESMFDAITEACMGEG